MSEILKDALKPFPLDFPAILGTKKPTNTGLAGCFSQSSQVDPAGQKPNTIDPDLVV